MLRFAQLTRAWKLREYNFGLQPSEDSAQHQIVSMTPKGKDEVYWLTTTTGNYVVSGYLSKNCQQMNNPRDEAVTDFKAGWLQYYGFADESLNILAEVG